MREWQRPVGGWLKAVRQALGVSLREVGGRLKMSAQAIHQFEKSEARGAISLRQLEAVAGAMGCKVVYTLVPQQEATLVELAQAKDRQSARGVRHSMLLEGQDTGEPAKPE